ncbi:MAG: PAS domain S-box protein [Rhodocyclaceae bacterium]|nr:PAS domain S-box protein [Rhodocyclaceae bacterium]
MPESQAPIAPASQNGTPSGGILGVVLSYAAFAGLWILVSDLAVEWLLHDPALIILVSTLKGWLFVAVTSLLLYGLIKRLVVQLTEAGQREAMARDEHRHSMGMLSAIVDSSSDAIFAEDVEGRYILFNQAASQFVGKPIGDVLGQDDRALFPEQAEMLAAIRRQVIDENRVSTRDEKVDTPSGEKVFLATKGPLRDAEGKVMGIFGVSRDITDQKRADLALRESEARYRTVVEHVKEVIFQTDAQGLWTFLNPAWTEITGFPLEESLGTLFLDYVHPDDRQRNAELFEPLIQRRKDYCRHEIRYLHKDGGYRWIEVYARLTLDEAGGIVGTSGTLNDISARKLAEEALYRQAEELRGRNRELERFNRAMVGREMDMIALKQRINELSLDLGRPAPFALAFLDGPGSGASPDGKEAGR